jgi:hypothetical protein
MFKYFLFLLLFSCASYNQPLNTTTIYKKDLTFWVNDKKIVGVGVVPKAANYEIFIDYKAGNIDLLSLVTCHRQINLAKQDHKLTYNLSPSKIELEGNCPLDLGVYDLKGRHGWGYLIFSRAENKLMAKIECNGEVYENEGVSICQGQIGTAQRITFTSAVKEAASPGCELKKIGNAFEYEVKKDFCYFSFIDSNHNFHDHTAFGYETFIIRE